MVNRGSFAAVLGIAAVLMTPMQGTASQGHIAAKDNAVRKMNVSGRQRMLTQRMSMALCFASTGQDRDRFRAVARRTSELFAKSQTALRDGDLTDSMLPEEEPGILAELNKVETLWAEFYPIVQSGLDGDLSVEGLQRLSDQNIPLLTQANSAVSAFEQHLTGVDQDPELKSTINVAGRQRMLSQKAAKELCFIFQNVNAEAHRAALRTTIDAFDQAIQDLLFGNTAAGVMAPPTDQILWQYDTLYQSWQDISSIYHNAANGGSVSAQDMKRVAAYVDRILKEANSAVSMYQEL